MTLTPEQVVRSYFQALEAGNYDSIISCFSKYAIIDSPVYGKVQASDFLKGFLKDTTKAKITILDLFAGKAKPHVIAAHVYYQWILKNSQITSFEGVFLFETTTDGRIAQLRIYYDAATARSLINKTGGPGHFPFFK